MIHTWVPFHLSLTTRARLILLTNISTTSDPVLIPAYEWRVCPPIARAAIPVVAVTAMASNDLVLRSSLMMARRRTDFPVPETRHEEGETRTPDSKADLPGL